MLALVPASAAANSETRIIVKRDPGLSAAERRDIRADADVRYVERLSLPRTEVVAAAPGDAGDAVRDLNSDPDVVYAERDRRVRALATGPDDCGPYDKPTTPAFDPCLWGVNRIFEDDPAAAWLLSEGAGRTVAVVDSGVDAAHPDLAGQVSAGWDFVEGDADPQDEDGHGTHVAGTIAAGRENDTGIAGVAPRAKVVPLRVLDGDGNGLVSDTLDAYDWAADPARGVRVVNASLGGEGFLQSEYDTLESHPDVLFVVAAGNAGKDNDDPSTATYPCAYGIDHLDRDPPAPALDNILCVGASDKSDQRASFSNHGATSVDLYAPGVGIVSTSLGALYSSDGTSMATPHVAATAALLAARNPWLDTVELKQAILDGADAVDAGPRLNALKSLNAAPEDLDGDGFLTADGGDNCADFYNPGQEDADGNLVGDACEDGAEVPDRDGDGVDDASDACPDEAWDGEDGCPLPAVTAADDDHDGVSNAQDVCPTTMAPGGGFGCPDADGDLVPNDGRDNCEKVANPAQTDTDNDGIGDACDPTPRGHDNDRDGKPRLDDSCPNDYGTLPNGCPAPPDSDGDGRADRDDGCPTVYGTLANGCPPPPVAAPAIAQVTKLSAKAKKRGRKRSARIVVRTTGEARVRIIVQRKRGRRWVRVARRTRSTRRDRASLTVKRLKRGKHRVRISISSPGGRGETVTERFRVR